LFFRVELNKLKLPSPKLIDKIFLPIPTKLTEEYFLPSDLIAKNYLKKEIFCYSKVLKSNFQKLLKRRSV